MDADASAVERVRSGDTDAFRFLVERHGRSVFRLAYRMTGNEFDAEDVVQEAFMRAYRQLDAYESRSSFATWIFRIASNYALDIIRARQRQDRHLVRPASGDESDPLHGASSGDPGPDRLYFSSQIQHRVAGALEELTPQEKTAFLLRHFEGKSIEEIGAVLGTGASATKNSIFRAVRKLREALHDTASTNHAALG